MKQKKYLAALIVVLIVVFVAYFLIKDRMVIMFKSTGQRTYVAHVVCGDDIVTEYNAVYAINHKSYDDTKKEMSQKLGSLAEKIQKLNTHESDATCVYIMLDNALNKGDKSLAEKYYNQLKAASNGRLYIDTKIDNFLSLRTLSDRLSVVGDNNSVEESKGE
jgi:hypothetical protein